MKMKVEELVHRVAGEALSLLERRYHYRISEDHKKDIQSSIKDNINELLSEKKQEPEKEEEEE